MRFQGGTVTASQLQAENVRRIRTLDWNAQGLERVANDGGSGLQERIRANQELAANLRQQVQYQQQNLQAVEQETAARKQTLEISRQQTEQDRNRAQSSAEGFGRLSDRDMRRRSALIDRAQRNGLDWRTASAIERLGGETDLTSDYFTRRGQAAIDSTAAGYRPEGARSSGQIAQLEAKLKQLEEVERSLVGKIGDTVDSISKNVLNLSTRLEQTDSRQAELERRLAMGWK